MQRLKQADIFNFSRRQRYATVSSISTSGTPQSALVGIATSPALEIVFDTLKTTRKYQNLIARPACSLVIGWNGEQTLQLEGEAWEPRDAELLHYQEIYFSAWPDGRARMGWPDIAWIVVRPRWLRFSDYNESPPFVAELQFPPLR